MMTTVTASAVESRLRRIEAQLGIPDETITYNDIESRLVSLERHFQQQQSSSSTSSTNTGGVNHFAAWIEIDKMMEDLSAGSALTHQTKSGIAAPMIYRRQDVLASADTLKRDMEYLSIILNSVLVDNRTINTTITEEQVANAPILINTIVTQAQQEKMDNLSSKLIDLQSRIASSTEKLDRLVYHYHQLVQALSEKLVAADEAMSQLE